MSNIDLQAAVGGMDIDRVADAIRLPNNYYRLRHFYSALYAGATATGGPPAAVSIPTNNVVRVATFGDSVGTSKPNYVCGRLRDGLGNAGGFFGNANTAGGATALGGVNDSTYWISGTYYSIPSGGSVNFLQGGGRPVCDSIKIYYVTRPGAGTFKVQTNDGSGYSDEAGYTSVDASSETIGAGIISLTKAAGTANSVKIVGLTGVVEVIGATYMDTASGGLVEYNMTRGGLPLSTFNGVPEAIRSTVLNDLAFDLVFMEFKDGSEFPAEFADFTSFMSTLAKPFSYCFIATSPESVGTGTTGPNNAVVRDYAIENNCMYFDGYGVFGSYADLAELGWEGDGVHLSQVANLFAANILWHEMGLNDALLIKNGLRLSVGKGKSIDLAGGSSSGRVLWTDPSLPAYSPVAMDFNIDLNLSGGRNTVLWSAGKASKRMVVSDSRTEVPFLALIPPGSASVGPALRPLGTAQNSGMRSSDISPGNGSAVCPFQASEYRLTDSAIKWSSGAGSPEGVVTGNVGSLYSRTDGGAGTTLYVKESGTGNTGWVAK